MPFEDHSHAAYRKEHTKKSGVLERLLCLGVVGGSLTIQDCVLSSKGSDRFLKCNDKPYC